MNKKISKVEVAYDWSAFQTEIDASDTIAIVAHFAPDGDAIGSLIALTLALRGIGKTVVPVCQDGVPSRFSYLLLANEVKPFVDLSNYDLVIFLDANEINRFGTAIEPEKVPLIRSIMVDHHTPTNLPAFSMVNIVDKGASSTCEIIYKYIYHAKYEISENIAESLLTGIVTDTSCFRNTGTTPDSLVISANLMRYGASLHKIVGMVIDSWSKEDIHVLGEGLRMAKFNESNGVAYTVLDLQTQKSLGVAGRPGNNKALVNALISTEDTLVSLVFVETLEGGTSVSMRSKPFVDLTPVFTQMGGGGHKNAAGFTTQRSTEEVVKETLSLVDAVINPPKQ